ncbi:exported hypothetical protein [Bosea sp. 62]|nr:exported hypothetical protein [Bosea sp. 46]CAD5256943.1 exported hypothetical protein [Bosea sp. 21B]CAD5284128.1 exported hypothetical protein [Bosea sp. 7B]VVT56411.1 exported hypothetical protein [Bosea sp. EC-HK365B]VXB33924.1 exported hypothetical protein [Bosea sp. 29B]VXB77498.1 exported hypothetical protein [Bosea sp. 125]VXC61618.1 exported hypothetical protein [Bosea sp. 62]VXC90867.1 exported hypothetical protein [Bosea sp. 127]
MHGKTGFTRRVLVAGAPAPLFASPARARALAPLSTGPATDVSEAYLDLSGPRQVAAVTSRGLGWV